MENKIACTPQEMAKGLKNGVQYCVKELKKKLRCEQYKFQTGYKDKDGDCFYIEMRITKVQELPNSLKE